MTTFPDEHEADQDRVSEYAPDGSEFDEGNEDRDGGDGLDDDYYPTDNSGPRGLDDPERETSSTLALWEGDDGGLTEAQRRTLVVLLKHRFISARTHPNEWRTLIANPRPVRARLNDTFMDLHVDTRYEVAYKRQVTPESGGRYPTLLHDTPWNREETVLLVHLRDRHRAEQASGSDRAFIDRASMLEHVAQLRPEHATDLSGDAKKTSRAIESLFSAGLLIGAKDGDRFEISAAVEVLMSHDKLRELRAWLEQQNSRGTTSGDVQTAIAMPAGDEDDSVTFNETPVGHPDQHESADT